MIGLIGTKGFVGSSLVKELSSIYRNVISITRENYKQIKELNIEFEVLIDCCGNSSKRKAEKDPIFSLDTTVKPIYEIARDFKCNSYIYISSIDVLSDTIYGFHKAVAEKAISQLYEKFTSLRCGAIIGKNAVKGLTYDITHNKPVFINKNSTQQLIHVKELATFINFLLLLDKWKSSYNCLSWDNITPEKIGEILEKPIMYADKLEYQDYNYLITEGYKFKTCKEALNAYKEEYE